MGINIIIMTSEIHAICIKEKKNYLLKSSTKIVKSGKQIQLAHGFAVLQAVESKIRGIAFVVLGLMGLIFILIKLHAINDNDQELSEYLDKLEMSTGTFCSVMFFIGGISQFRRGKYVSALLTKKQSIVQGQENPVSITIDDTEVDAPPKYT